MKETLFGHEKEAFTGAVATQIGFLETSLHRKATHYKGSEKDGLEQELDLRDPRSAPDHPLEANEKIRSVASGIIQTMFHFSE